MPSIGSYTPCPVPIGASVPGVVRPAAAVPRPVVGTGGLTLGGLSDRAFAALNVMAAQGSDREKELAGLAKGTLARSDVPLSPRRQTALQMRFEARTAEGTLVLLTHLNERTEHDLLEVGLTRGSEPYTAVAFPGHDGEGARRESPRPTLANLPPELLRQIARDTGTGGKGVNPALRLANRQLRCIADAELSTEQRFRINYGPRLQPFGYTAGAMNGLAGRSEAELDFVLAHGAQLQAVGFDGFDLNELAQLKAPQRAFVLTHAPTLFDVGYAGASLTQLAQQRETARNFVLAWAEDLYAAGFQATDMMLLAQRIPTEREFVAVHAQDLRAAGYGPDQMNDLASLLPAQQDFVIAHGVQLHRQGYTGARFITQLAARPRQQRRFILAHAAELRAAGYASTHMLQLAARRKAERDFVVLHGARLRQQGCHVDDINVLAARPDRDALFTQALGPARRDVLVVRRARL